MKKLAALLLTVCLVLPIGFGLTEKKAKAAELIIGTEGSYDVVVYGASSAGITSAIAAKREGADVLLISQNNYVGGLTSSGLGATDIANKNVVGGITWEFYNRVYQYYQDESAWTSETSEEYFSDVDNAIYGGKDDALQMQWVFEPKVADMIFRRMLADDRVPVIFNEPIDLENGVSKAGGRITEIVSESGKKFSAKVFVDCSYEGDLMAEAGVTYTVGREANGEYGETMNGILPNDNEYQNTSPYIVDGDPDSGLLPFVEDSPLGAKGDADSRVQAYCFRFTLSTDPDNRVPITRPENYHPEWYESRARLLQANPSAGCELTQNRMPNKKTDTNHADFVGMSYEYADGDYLSRRNIEDDHKDYVLGLLYFYAYDERVPASVREEMLNYGLAKDEFTENGNFPIQIYLREGRRMVSDYVMKESDVIQNSVPGVIQKTTAPHSVGQGFYWFDSHRVAYFKSESSLGAGIQTDGNFWSTRRDYPISYESIRPVKEECANLYVPVCLSSTHAAYGSIRMETTYMIVGESAGVAAAMSAKEMAEDPAFCVQDLDYASLAIRLAQNGQYLGDIVADDMSKGELNVLKLNILGLTDADGAAVLYEGVKTGFNTPERVGAVKNVLVASANRIAEGTAESETLKILNKFGIISNTASWEGLFGETLPASLPMDNVVSIFDKIAAFFAKESPLGYITDWVNYFAEHGIIDEEARRYFDDNAIGGRTCDTAKTQALVIAIAQTIDPSAADGDSALQIFINTKITGNAAVWEDVFRGTAASVSGSNLNGLLKNAYSYLKNNEKSWMGKRIEVSAVNYLVSKNVFTAADVSEVLVNTEAGRPVSADFVKAAVLSGAKYFDPTADAETAVAVLKNAGADTSGVEKAYNGETVDGAEFRSYLSSLAETMKNAVVTEPLTEEIVDYFTELGIIKAEDGAYYMQNAVQGGAVDGAKLNAMLSRISSRVEAEGATSLEKLKNLGVITEEQATALGGANVSGKTANEVIRSVYDFVGKNNVTLTEAELGALVSVGAITEGEKAAIARQISAFGFIGSEKTDAIFLALAKRIDETAADRESALAVLKDINAVLNPDGWNTQLASGEISGKDLMAAVSVSCKFIAGTLEDYEYLEEKGVITAEQAAYFVRRGNNSNKAEGTKIVELLVALAKPFDAGVSDGTSAVATLKAQGVIGNDAGWLAIVNDPEKEVTVENLVNLVEKATDKIMTLDASELSDEVLDWYVAQGIIKEGNYGKEYYKKNAKTGGTLNQGETQNMLVRAFRKVTGNAGATASNLPGVIDKSDFTFSDDQGGDAALREYWYARIESKTNPVDGEMLRVLMIRIYDYMNGGVSE